jgi:hypothetical protein
MFDLFLGLRLGGCRRRMERKTKSKRSWDLDPFLGIFGFWDYVTGMGMSAHGFTHV